ncbi:MAG: DNA adenine methylase [Paludibacteraceae bacterium]
MKSIVQIVGNDLNEMIFCDLFAGTGVVGRIFKPEVKKIISNDIEYYSYALNRNYIGNNKQFDHSGLLCKLNRIEGKAGFIFDEYSENGRSGRQYFTQQNGQKIDAIRQTIEDWKLSNYIDNDVYFFLLASLLESADKVANTASVYGAYLKHIKKSAQKTLLIEPATYTLSENKHEVFNEDSNMLIKKISGDILYLDPPYNAREYGANYHILNTIAQYDHFIPAGKTGLRNYLRSNYCKRNRVEQSFEELIRHTQFRYVFLSYNNEGLMPPETIRKIMEKYGKFAVFTTNYQRFKADKTESRNHKADSTQEFLYVLEKL